MSVLAWQAQHPDQRLLETEATLVFGDISGFTPLVEQRSAMGRRGGEEVTDLLNLVFTDLLSIAREEGGDVLKFGGDAFLLMFGGEGGEARAAVAAIDMQDALSQLAVPGLSMSMGLATGPVELHLAGDRHRELVVTGKALAGALTAETEARSGEVVVGHESRGDLPVGVLDPETHPLLDLADDLEVPRTEASLDEVNLDLADYVPEALRPHLTLGGAMGEHRQATVGFLHIAVEPDEAERTSSAVGETMSLVQESAARHEVTFLGSDVDLAGCKVILVAGAPVATSREEERVLRTLHRVMEEAGPLPLRAGVARGVVFAADVGAPFRHGYTVIGDTVNLAARLMGAAGERQLLTTKRVIDLSPTRFRITQLQPIRLKGKLKPVSALAVGPITGVDRESRAAKLPLVGRDDELRMIRRAITDVRLGLGSALEVVGEAGIGKTRILSEARDLAGTLDSYTLVCEEYEVNTPYYMAGHLVRGMLGLQPDTPSSVVESRVEEVVAEHAPELEPWMPLIGVPLGIEIPDTPTTAEIDASFRTSRMHEKVEQFLAAVHPGPAVVIVEDAHWIDPASAGVLARLVEAAESRPWLVLVGRRGDGTWVSSPRATVLHIEPLGSAEIGELLRLAAREHPVSDHDLNRVAERCAGHPLFALELLEGYEEGELPDSIEAKIAERIDRLDPRDRQILRYAAVLGGTFTLDLLAEALPSMAQAVEDSETWRRLGDFLEVSIIGTVTFRHDLIRAAAYRGLPYRFRREVHGVVVDALERRLRRRPERHASLLALHHSQAENWEATWRFALMAAERARDRFATAEAAELYLLALRAADHLTELDSREVMEAAESLGEMAGLAGRPEVAVEGYERAEQLAPEGTVDAARLLRRKGALQINQGDYPTAVALLEEGMAAVEANESHEAVVERIELMLAMAGAYYRMGEFQTCADMCRRAVAEADRIDHRSGLAHGGFLMILTNLALGHDDPRDYGGEALQIYEELGDLVGQGNVWNNMGMAAYYRGDWDSALEAWERSREARTRAGDAAGAATSINNLGEVFSDRGDLDRAEDMFRDSLRAYQAAGFPTGVALATSNLGRVESRRGQRQKAVGLLEEARSLFAELGAQAFVAETQYRIAEAHAFGGWFEEAISALTGIPDGIEVLGLVAGIERLRGVAAWHAGDRVTAETHLMASVAAAEEANVPYEGALSQDLLAKLSGESAMQHAADEILSDLGAGSAARLPVPRSER